MVANRHLRLKGLVCPASNRVKLVTTSQIRSSLKFGPNYGFHLSAVHGDRGNGL
jgi:hypothetical protein